MIIIFFGLNNRDWMDVLNNKLLSDFSNETCITDIKNIYDVNKLLQLDLSSAYVIPLMEPHMIQLHNRNIKALMPSLDHIIMFSCKKRFASYVEEHNLQQYTPKVYPSIDETPTYGLYIIKPYNLNNGAKMRITTTVDERDFENKIVQEYIENIIEYSAYIVSKNGHIRKCITYMSVFDNAQHIKSYPKNVNKMNKIELDDKYVKQLELFFLCCGYSGISNVDFIIQDDQIKVFEINPRLGGGLIRADKSDVVEILLEMINIDD